MDFWLEQLTLLILSLLANGLSALAGGGAGLLQLPVLLFLGLSFGTALATHKIASVALGIGATLRHLREGQLDLRFCAFVVACGLPGVVLGAVVVLALPEALTIFSLGLLTCGLGIYSITKKQLGMEYRPRHRDLSGYLIGGLVICLIGFLNGSLTSGTGLFVTLWLVRWFGFDYQRAVTYVLILVGLFWNSTGALAVALQTAPRWEWLPALLLGAVVGAYAGAHLSLARGNRLVKRAFETLTVMVGIKLIGDGLAMFSGATS
ncbi:sulfite exporter TauE/SafE family protein [Marinobacterium arenosum]|uniref:sulfite exporter TauE/SafE family protein n=1 Tax=Marinobacterium arenosum TaxID=2862496 RepID=UPI001C950E32|nr:sulfite exporter TauE/SafE family protein [Marinobacterium arenosum]MBY4678916.1 sulfite exporter TauE/SafE family protein [Marinobacterium arenosum]